MSRYADIRELTQLGSHTPKPPSKRLAQCLAQLRFLLQSIRPEFSLAVRVRRQILGTDIPEMIPGSELFILIAADPVSMDPFDVRLC